MNQVSDRTLRKRGISRTRRHGRKAKDFKRKNLDRRWLAHQRAGFNGYRNALP